MSDTDDRSMGDALTNRRYKIPYYQRGYVWTESQANDLIEDIEFAVRKDVPHYFGNIVLSETESEDVNNKLDIIDGQQRLTTLNILFADMYWFCKELKEELENNYSKDECKETIKLLEDNMRHCRRIFLVDSGAELEPSNVMLRTAEQQRNIFQSILFNHPDGRMVDANRYSERKIVEVEKKMWEWLRSHRPQSGESKKQIVTAAEMIEKIIVKIQTDFNITEYIVEDDEESGRIFGIVNDRGKDLNIADKVKSTLVYEGSVISEPEEGLVEEIHDAFSYVYENVASGSGGVEEVNEFMKSHWYMFAGFDSEYDMNNLHKEIMDGNSHLDSSKSDEEKKDWIEFYIFSLREAADAYEEITTFNKDGLSKTEIEIKRRHYYFDKIAQRNFLSLRLSANICLTENEQKRLLDNIEAVSLRVHEIAKRGSNTFGRTGLQMSYKMYCVYNNTNNERVSTSEIFNTQKGRYKGLTMGDVVREVKKKAEEKYNKDEVVFDVRSYLDTDDVIRGGTENGWAGCSRRVIKYALFRICEQKGTELWEQGLNSPELEHIRPESESREDGRNKVCSLGNLCVLEREYNSNCSNKDYKDKVEEYKKSNFSMPEKLVKRSKRDWTDKKIDARKKDMKEDIMELHN